MTGVATAPLFPRQDFALPQGLAHVCAGGEPAFLQRHAQAYAAYARDKAAGMPGRTAQEAEVLRVRGLLARRFGCATEEIGFVSSVAEGVAMLAESLDWREGDTVLVAPDEYPSVVAPFLALDRAAVRFVPLDRMEGAADRSTRVIGVSAASYLTGARPALEPLRALADRCGAWLVVDYTQAAGWMPLEARIADFAFASSYKWLLGTTGIATAFWNRERQPGWAPRSAGWHSLAPGHPPLAGARTLELVPDAMRFCRGNPAHLPLYLLGSALDYLDRWPDAAVERHVQSLTTALLEGLAEAGIRSTTPRDPQAHGASVCIPTDRDAAMRAALEAEGVLAWSGRGRIRFSFHGYNDREDVARILAALLPLRG